MKLKKRLAVLLTAAMVLSMSVPTFADEVSYGVPDGGSSIGVGEAVPHLEKELGNVVLPVEVSSNAFNYTVDPERLVQATNGAKYTGFSFADGAMADGVFFLVSGNTFSSKTEEYEIENRSSFPIDLTVSVTTSETRPDNGLQLLSYNELGSATEAGLYLGLKVGNDAAIPVKYGTPATKTLSINGVPYDPENPNASNFMISYNAVTDGYEFKAKTGDLNWEKSKFQIEGVATKGLDIEENAAAPGITVTWKWKKYGEVEYFDSHDISTSSPSVGMTLPSGVSISSVTLYKAAAPETPIELVAGTTYIATTTSFALKNEHITAWGAGSKVVVKFSNNKKETINIQ